jgi:hypothetical protein
MIDRLHHAQRPTDFVDIRVAELEAMTPGIIPNFSGDGYIQSNLAGGWHALFRDVNVEKNEFMDHLYLVNQHTGQQLCLKLGQATPMRRSLVVIESEFDTIEHQLTAILHSTDAGGYQLNWKARDSEFKDTKSLGNEMLYSNINGVMVEIATLADPRLSYYWARDVKTIDFPGQEVITERLMAIKELIGS